MNLKFEEFIDDIDTLIEFLISDTWEFYGTPNPKPERVRASYENNYFTGGDCRTFWVVADENTKIGMVRMYDLENGDPLFDIRILSKYKGNGIGTKTIKWMVDFIFSNYPDKERIEANTRQDNYAMRSVFNKCGFVKEAHHRKAWVGSDGVTYDAIGYGIIKEDWMDGKVTLVNWDDFKY